jgi:hypothetical protein
VTFKDDVVTIGDHLRNPKYSAVNRVVRTTGARFEEDAANRTNTGAFEVTICDFKFEREPKPKTLWASGAIMIAIHRKDN